MPSPTRFRGAGIVVTASDGLFELTMRQHGLLRPLATAELSDGTLRYLLLVAALLTPRPPELMILNEPETSLHPDLLAPLGRLIATAAERSQVLVVTHAAGLTAALRGSRAAAHGDRVDEGVRRDDRARRRPGAVDVAAAVRTLVPRSLLASPSCV